MSILTHFANVDLLVAWAMTRNRGSVTLKQFADGLGWFSVGLGVSELLLPGGLAKLIGVKNKPLLFRLLGLRELSSGIGILSRSRPTGWVWSRVLGDAMDLALLGAAFSSERGKTGRLAAATAAVAGVTALDVLCGQQLSRNGTHAEAKFLPIPDRTIRYKKTTIIDRPTDELYRFWRNFENLPRFMYHLESVRTSGETRSHWVAKAPMGSKVEWDAEITEDRPNELIAWRSTAGDVENSGSVRFIRAPGNRGTLVAVELEYKPPGGKLGAAIAKLFREEPGEQVKDSLRFFKQLMETGEIARIRGQSAGRSRGVSKKFDYPVPAQSPTAAALPV
jgi:uncharacterized membrane protein